MNVATGQDHSPGVVILLTQYVGVVNKYLSGCSKKGPNRAPRAPNGPWKPFQVPTTSRTRGVSLAGAASLCGTIRTLTAAGKDDRACLPSREESRRHNRQSFVCPPTALVGMHPHILLVRGPPRTLVGEEVRSSVKRGPQILSARRRTTCHRRPSWSTGSPLGMAHPAFTAGLHMGPPALSELKGCRGCAPPCGHPL